MKEKYWFAFRVKGGSSIALGPYNHDRVMAERERAKALDTEVSVWFIADSPDEAQQKANFHLP